MTAKETLVETLTNALAVTRVGRMDAHRKEAERLVDEVLHEAAMAQWEHAVCLEPEHGGLYLPEALFGLPDLIDPYKETK